MASQIFDEVLTLYHIRLCWYNLIPVHSKAKLSEKPILLVTLEYHEYVNLSVI